MSVRDCIETGRDWCWTHDQPYATCDGELRTTLGGCRVFWGSHGCDRPRGHAGPHLCLSCWTEDEEGWVGAPPYYGPDTHFYGEDADV